VTAAAGALRTEDASLTLLRGDPPAWVERWVIVLAAGEALAGDALAWPTAIAVLEHGSIVLEQAGGERLSLDEGAVFFLAGLRLVAIRNDGLGRAVIACAGRRATLL
jgi:hypothetical protein